MPTAALAALTDMNEQNECKGYITADSIDSVILVAPYRSLIRFDAYNIGIVYTCSPLVTTDVPSFTHVPVVTVPLTAQG